MSHMSPLWPWRWQKWNLIRFQNINRVDKIKISTTRTTRTRINGKVFFCGTVVDVRYSGRQNRGRAQPYEEPSDGKYRQVLQVSALVRRTRLVIFYFGFINRAQFDLVRVRIEEGGNVDRKEKLRHEEQQTSDADAQHP